MDSQMTRAMSAYHKTGDEMQPVPSASKSGAVKHEDKEYVVLRNINGVLAVYRVRTSGALKRLRRWPAAVEAW